MTPFFLITVAALLSALVVAAIQTNPLQAGTVDPFAPPARPRESASDTISDDPMTRTSLPDRGAGSRWHVRTLTDLSEVECLLDRLEACGVTTREVDTIGEEGFAVRWM